MNRVLELEAMQKQAEETLRAEREHAAAAKQRAQTSLQRFTCSICLEKSIERSLVPCGHAFCEYCINHLPGSRCPTCRSHIERKQKLFLGESDEATV
ncbi:hypothetical protein EON64_00780 [archaeon]|nr:MAG: hypothetical protein EON64_00780 [archaeon]